MDAKIRIKMGTIEVEYEGSEDFLKGELLSLLSELLRLQKESATILGKPFSPPSDGDGEAKPPQGIQATTTTIAAKLACKSGPDLIIAAALRLTLTGSKTFSRQTLLDEMKTASGYYKKSFSGNLSHYLQTLVKGGKLFETATDIYVLNEATRKELEAKIAG
jgi:hypothetical protein